MYQHSCQNLNPQRHTTPKMPNGYVLPGTNRNRHRNYEQSTQQLTDYGPYPFVTDIEEITKRNINFRTALWTGRHLQVSLMSLLPGEDIGLEQHPDIDQFIRIEQGKGVVMMGDNPNNPNFQQTVSEDYAFVIPAGKWHNLTNIGNMPLKLYSIYSPIQHPYGTLQPTKADAEAAEK